MPRQVRRAEVYQKGGSILEPGDIVAVQFVTVVGHADDFAVYMGAPRADSYYIADHGDKVSEEVGRAVAPYCAHLRYRG